MNDSSLDANRSEVAGIILAEAKGLRDKQDTRLQSYRRVALAIYAGYLSIWPLVASGKENFPLTRLAGVATLLGVLAAAAAAAVQMPIRSWREGPEIDVLVSEYYALGIRRHEVERDLALSYHQEHGANERRVGQAAFYLAAEMLLVFTSLAALVASLANVW